MKSPDNDETSQLKTGPTQKKNASEVRGEAWLLQVQAQTSTFHILEDPPTGRSCFPNFDIGLT